MLQADPLDLLFENRNKMYGAYPLRKYYHRRLLISMGITFSMVVICCLAYIIFQSTPVMTTIYTIPDTKIDPIYYPPAEKPIPPPARPAAPKPMAATQDNTPLIVRDNLVLKPIATIEQLSETAIGQKDESGNAGNDQMNHNNGTQGTVVTSVNEVPDENNNLILDKPEIMPEFPGGMEALKRFLLKNLRVPENSLDAGEQVKVIARFVVGADGRVRDIEITQGAEAVFEKEVKRVIGRMPEWKPGSQNHRNVAVYFNLPVNFVGAEER